MELSADMPSCSMACESPLICSNCTLTSAGVQVIEQSCMCDWKLTAKGIAVAESASFFGDVELACALHAFSSSALSPATCAMCLHSYNQQQLTICLLACSVVCTIASQNERQCIQNMNLLTSLLFDAHLMAER